MAGTSGRQTEVDRRRDHHDEGDQERGVKITMKRCSICGIEVSDPRSVVCKQPSGRRAHSRKLYKRKKERQLRDKRCYTCGKRVGVPYSDYCSERCFVLGDGVSRGEVEAVRGTRGDIVEMAELAALMPEDDERISEIEERLHRRYGEKYKRFLPRSAVLEYLGFGERSSEYATALFMAGLLSGGSYRDIAIDISRYRKLFDYGIISGQVE